MVWPVSRGARTRGGEGGLCAYRYPDDAGVGLDPCSVGVAEEGEAADGGGDGQLHRQDGVYLADELVADVDGRFGHGASELDGVSVCSGERGLEGRTLKSSGRLSSLLRGGPKRPWLSSRDEEPSA